MESYNSISSLRELHGSGYEIVDGQPDIIGWTIKDINDSKIGVVDDLLFDPEQQKVRYIIANFKDNQFDLDKRKVLIPIGLAELHETSDDVILPSIARWQLRALPTYSQRMTDYDERDINTIFSSGAGATISEQDKQWQKPKDFYNNPSYDHDNLFRKRRKAEQKDMPIQRTLRERPGATVRDEYRERETGVGRGASESAMYEPDSMAVNRESNQGPEKYNVNTDNESVLNKIKRMQQELGEIERDLRSERGQR